MLNEFIYSEKRQRVYWQPAGRSEEYAVFGKSGWYYYLKYHRKVKFSSEQCRQIDEKYASVTVKSSRKRKAVRNV